MKLHNKSAEIFAPDGASEALGKTTHLAVAAHQDDIEIMAYHGIVECFGRSDRWFGGVVVTDGAGSPREGLYAEYTDEQMRQVRRQEQKKAAVIGEYGSLALLDYPSAEVKDSTNHHVVDDIKSIISRAGPEVVYTHNPADKHDTHVAVMLRTVQAIRELPLGERPEKLWGCEVWRNLDWLPDRDKLVMDVSAHENLAVALVGVFDSQICGGKRYDLAALGRWKANATFFESHGTDVAQSVIFGIDLTPLITDDSLDVGEYVGEYIKRFADDVARRIAGLKS